MDKNTVIGIILMGCVLFGFTWYQQKQYTKQAEAQAVADSIARAQQAVADSLFRAEHPEAVASVQESAPVPAAPDAAQPYEDSLLHSASLSEARYVTLSNDRVELSFSTLGGQPWSARLKEFRCYDSTDLYLFRPGKARFGLTFATALSHPQYIDTREFQFQVGAHTDSTLVMEMPFADGGRLEYRYKLRPDAYVLDFEAAFIGMGKVLSRSSSLVNVDFGAVIPRLEKGYRNEVQYSRLCYLPSGVEKPVEMTKNKRETSSTKVSWVAFHQQFFSAILRAPGDFASGEMDLGFLPEDDAERNLMDCDARMKLSVTPGADVSIPLEFYFGPNHYQTLKKFGQHYEKTIPLGGWLVGWFTKYVIIPLFNWLHRFIDNFGIIILLMTLFIKLVVLPLSYKSYASSAKMQALRPEIEKINEKYPKQEDAMKKQQATMDLYKRAGISPMGGCLPMLLQFPILWAMFRFFPASIELRQQPFLWADDLSAYDSIVHFGTRIPLLGDHVSLFALLMAVSMFFYSKITTAQQTASNDPNAATMKFMSVWMMPIMMFFICNSLSSGLSYYYLLSNLITMLETFVIKRWFVDREAILARIKASEGKPVQKSKWQLRLEEAQRMQREAQRKQQQNRRG